MSYAEYFAFSLLLSRVGTVIIADNVIRIEIDVPAPCPSDEGDISSRASSFDRVKKPKVKV